MAELPTWKWPLRLELPGYVELIFSLVIVWGFADALSTIVAMTISGSPASEINPWIQVLLTHEPLLVIVLKGAVALYVGVVLLACQDLVQKVPGWRLWLLGLVAAGALVVIQNLTFVAATL